MTVPSADRNRRPSPEAMLAVARREEAEQHRGRLKVFLGAAPGVGKTYAMLSAARQCKVEGIDVVAGVVETHGRAETEALLAGLEILPRKVEDPRLKSAGEFDLEAALSRRPALILVDELAHTNPSNSLHPKRYLDVLELLDAGIDVWTTMNVQHLESLSDVVSRISGIIVRERVPDTVLDKADEVVMVDITPDDLIQRLKDGKVYLPDNARRAIDNFFKPGNLTALRELALRRTAEQVDDKMVSLLREREIEGPWPTSDRLLVCIGANERSEIVVRAAARLAKSLKASFVAVYLERLGAETTDSEKLKRIDEIMRLARRLGAETTRLTVQDLPGEILAYARRENITQIVIGRSSANWLARFRGRSLSDEIVQQAHDIAVHVVTEGAPKERRPSFRLSRPRGSVGGSLTAVAAVAATVIIGMLINDWFDLPNLSLLFLAAVLYCALTQGVTSAIVAAFLSFLAYNFFFIPPIYSFTIAEPQELFALIVFLFVAVFTGGLAGHVREQADAIRRRNKSTQRLYEFSRKLSATTKLEELLWGIATQLANAVNGTSLILLQDEKGLAIKASWPPEDSLGPADAAAARWAFDHREAAGRQTSTLPNAIYQFRPLNTAQGVLGVVGIQSKQGIEALNSEDERMLAALMEQSAIAIERAQLADATLKAEALMESERLRSALLSSLSHDLRTPLSSILGAVTSIRSLGERMSETARADLLAMIEEEASRMTRFVANLLDMSRVEAGALELKGESVDIGEVLRAAIDRAERSFGKRKVVLALDPILPTVKGDAKLLEQVVFNLLDNADKYTNSNAPTMVAATHDSEMLHVSVSDSGSGMPPDELDRVFEKFYRVDPGDGRPAGTGLGLSICRGIVQAMGGTIYAESPIGDGHGTRIIIRLPIEAAAQA